MLHLNHFTTAVAVLVCLSVLLSLLSADAHIVRGTRLVKKRSSHDVHAIATMRRLMKDQEVDVPPADDKEQDVPPEAPDAVVLAEEADDDDGYVKPDKYDKNNDKINDDDKYSEIDGGIGDDNVELAMEAMTAMPTDGGTTDGDIDDGGDGALMMDIETAMPGDTMMPVDMENTTAPMGDDEEFSVDLTPFSLRVQGDVDHDDLQLESYLFGHLSSKFPNLVSINLTSLEVINGVVVNYDSSATDDINTDNSNSTQTTEQNDAAQDQAATGEEQAGNTRFLRSRKNSILAFVITAHRNLQTTTAVAGSTFYYQGTAHFKGPPRVSAADLDVALTTALTDIDAINAHLAAISNSMSAPATDGSGSSTGGSNSSTGGSGIGSGTATANTTTTTTSTTTATAPAVTVTAVKPSDPIPTDGSIQGVPDSIMAQANGVSTTEAPASTKSDGSLSTTGMTIVIIAACVGGLSLLIIVLVGMTGSEGVAGNKNGLPEQPLR